MSKKLFVGGLSWGTDDDGLRAAFERFGAIENAAVVRDHTTGKSRGFGFLTFPDDNAAQAAVAGMNGQELDGRSLTVNEAKEQRPGGGRGGPRRGGGGARDSGSEGNRRW